MNQLLLTDAAFKGDLNEVKRLLAEGYDINLEFDYGTVKRTPLDNAIENENLEVVRFLLENGAEVDRSSEFGTPLLHAMNTETDSASWRGEPASFVPSAATTTLLIELGADVNFKSEDGDLPLDFAMRNSHALAGEILRKHGALTAEDLRAPNL